MDEVYDKKGLVVRAAAHFAANAHKDQKYGEDPYIVHCHAVGQVLIRFGIKDDAILAAAFLHDVVEDTETTVQQIELMFGNRIADLVYRVTNEDGANRMAKHIKTYPKIKESEDALLLKLADRIANVEASQHEPGKMKMYKTEWKFFKESLYTPGLHEDMWKHLTSILEGK